MKPFNAGTWRASNWGEDIADCITVYLPGETEHDYEIRTLEDLDKIADAPIDLIAFVRGEVERARPKLEENEVQRDDFWPIVVQLRWHNGVAQNRRRDDETNWTDWKWGRGSDWEKRAERWFRAHCPIDRFVTDEGEVLEFRMRDDGQAEAMRGSDVIAETMPGAHAVVDWNDALYRFRDHERGKWKFDYAQKANHVGASIGGLWAGYWNANGWTPLNCYKSPAWVRQKAETLYREKNPEWRVEWREDIKQVNVSRGGVHAGYISCRRLDDYGEQWPPHILTQARAKFRENYQLKRDELWFRGMPVKMVFDLTGGAGSTPCVRVANPSLIWVESTWPREEWGKGFSFTDEAERLEGWDRCRRFYFEEHPGKCLHHRKDKPLTFHLTGYYGQAMAGDGESWYDSCNGLVGFGHELRNREKLRAWTSEQLKKREGEKVVFEGEWVSRKDDNTITLREITDKGRWSGECQRVARYRGSLRVTIEPIGGE